MALRGFPTLSRASFCDAAITEGASLDGIAQGSCETSLVLRGTWKVEDADFGAG